MKHRQYCSPFIYGLYSAPLGRQTSCCEYLNVVCGKEVIGTVHTLSLILDNGEKTPDNYLPQYCSRWLL